MDEESKKREDEEIEINEQPKTDNDIEETENKETEEEQSDEIEKKEEEEGDPEPEQKIIPKEIETGITDTESIREELKKIEGFQPKILKKEEEKNSKKEHVFLDNKIYVVGHRGCAGYEPENTIQSIKRAIEMGADAVEIDINLSKDGEAMVIHDETLDRTTDAVGRVDQTNYRGLKNLDAGNGQGVPTLQEVINICRDKVKLIIELKGEKTEKAVANMIRRNHIYNECYVISFWHNMIKKIKKIDPKINTGILLVGHPIRAWRLAKDADADILVMNYKFISKKLVEQAHKKGIKVSVWNIDNKDEIQRVVDMKVDSIGSNKPDIIVDYLKNLEE